MKDDHAKYLRWRRVMMANIGIAMLLVLWSLYWREWIFVAMGVGGALTFGISLYVTDHHYKTTGRP